MQSPGKAGHLLSRLMSTVKALRRGVAEKATREGQRIEIGYILPEYGECLGSAAEPRGKIRTKTTPNSVARTGPRALLSFAIAARIIPLGIFDPRSVEFRFSSFVL